MVNTIPKPGSFGVPVTAGFPDSPRPLSAEAEEGDAVITGLAEGQGFQPD